MSNLYGTLKGDHAKTVVTRCGHSQIKAHIRGWDVGVVVEGHFGNVAAFDIYISEGSNAASNRKYIGRVKLVDGKPTWIPLE